jgi:hypothetical protein
LEAKGTGTGNTINERDHGAIRDWGKAQLSEGGETILSVNLEIPTDPIGQAGEKGDQYPLPQELVASKDPTVLQDCEATNLQEGFRVAPEPALNLDSFPLEVVGSEEGKDRIQDGDGLAILKHEAS